jgi:hypothetical protein
MEKTARFFHGMEEYFTIIPRYGKSFRRFSMLWKNFHFGLFPMVFGCFLGLLSGARGAPCEP